MMRSGVRQKNTDSRLVQAFQFVKALVPSLSNLALLLAALVIMMASFTSSPLTEFVNSKLLYVTSIGYTKSYQVQEWIAAQQGYVKHWFFVISRNKEVEAELARLRQRELEFFLLKNEYEQLKRAYKFRPIGLDYYITAPVVMHQANQLQQQMLIYAGDEEEVSKHDIVIYQHQVVGRIITVADDVSRVMLLTDSRSHIPVYIGKEKIPAIVVGRNQDALGIRHVIVGQQLTKGDVVVTSGEGGVFPPGLVIGVVVLSEEFGGREYVIQPLISPATLSQVSVMKFQKLQKALVEEQAPAPQPNVKR